MHNSNWMLNRSYDNNFCFIFSPNRLVYYYRAYVDFVTKISVAIEYMGRIQYDFTGFSSLLVFSLTLFPSLSLPLFTLSRSRVCVFGKYNIYNVSCMFFCFNSSCGSYMHLQQHFCRLVYTHILWGVFFFSFISFVSFIYWRIYLFRVFHKWEFTGSLEIFPLTQNYDAICSSSLIKLDIFSTSFHLVQYTILRLYSLFRRLYVMILF